MEMKYYNPSNNFKAPIPREPKPYRPPEQKREVVIPKPPAPVKTPDVETPVSKQMETDPKTTALNQDDLLILGVILLLLLNSCEDYLLLLVLGYLFISGK